MKSTSSSYWSASPIKYDPGYEADPTCDCGCESYREDCFDSEDYRCLDCIASDLDFDKFIPTCSQCEKEHKGIILSNEKYTYCDCGFNLVYYVHGTEYDENNSDHLSESDVIQAYAYWRDKNEQS